VVKLLFLSYTTKKRARVIRTRKTIPINSMVFLRKPMKVIIVIAIN
jgi:hypothetical protein